MNVRGYNPKVTEKYGIGTFAVSLIICTRNRCVKLARCLRYVERITFDQPWELIIVDNGSSDGTAAVVQEFSKTAHIPVVYVFETKQGNGNGRNAGVNIARGEIMAFTDDDCYPAADFLKKTWIAFEDPSIGYITGRVILHDESDYPITINESNTPRVFPKNAFMSAGAVQGANMAFRKMVLIDIGGFDPLFGAGALFSAEDIDVASRASAGGWIGRYQPEVVVRHHHGRKAADAQGVWKAYAIGRGAYHMKLLLRGEFAWFARGIYGLRWRYKLGRKAILWEQVGATQYAYLMLAQRCRSWLSRVFGRDVT